MTLDVKALRDVCAAVQAAERAADDESLPSGDRYDAVGRLIVAEEDLSRALSPASVLALLDRLERAEARVALARVHLDALADFDDVRDWDTSQPDYIEREAAYDAAHTSLRAALDDEAPR